MLYNTIERYEKGARQGSGIAGSGSGTWGEMKQTKRVFLTERFGLKFTPFSFSMLPNIC